MSDEIDIAKEREQADTARAIQAARQGLALTATGFCLNCGEVLDNGLRFCGPDCRDDWEARSCRD